MRELTGLNEERLGAMLGMSRATLHRRKKTGHLDRAESDRLVRFARLFSRAAALGGADGARSWLVVPAVAFHGECPLDFADTEIGRMMMGRIMEEEGEIMGKFASRRPAKRHNRTASLQTTPHDLGDGTEAVTVEDLNPLSASPYAWLRLRVSK